MYIILEGKKFDLLSKPAITRQVNDIAELANRQADRSTTFVVAGTDEADAFFQSKQPSSSTAKMYEYIPASCPAVGISQGVAVFRRATAEGYEITLYGGIKDFFGQIAGKSLQDLRFPELDHNWNLSDVVSGLSRTDGYCYGLIDYGTLPTQGAAGDVFFDNFRPLIFEAYVLAAIAQSVGWTFEGRLFDSEEFQTRVIPWANDAWANGRRFAENNGINLFQAVGTANLSGSDAGGGAVTQKPVALPFSFFNNSGGTIELTVTGSVTISAWNLSDPSVGAALQFVRNGIPDASDLATITGVGSFSITITTILNPGDTLELAVVYGQPAGTNLPFTYNFDYTGGSVVTDFLDAEIRYDGVVHCEAMLPDMSQTDYLKSVAQRYCLTIQADNVTKVLSFRTWNDIAERRDGSIDLTDKLDSGGIVAYEELNKSFGDYAQSNTLNYKEDESVASSGDGKIEVQDETLKQSSTLFELAFANSDDVPVLIGGGERSVAQVKKIEANEPVVGSQEYLSTEPRVLGVEQSAFPSFTIDTGNLNGATQVLPSGDYNRAYFASGTFSNRFDALKERHYNLLESSTLNPIKQIKAQMYFEPSEVLNFNFFQPVYLQQFGLYFYCLNISNYTGGDTLTEVNLLKL